MSTGVSVTWAIVVIVVIPAVIILAAELDERMRQRESPLRSAVLILRNWSLPFFAIFALLVPVAGVERESTVARLAETALYLSIGAAALSALRIVMYRIRTRPRAKGTRPVPQLLLALPRLVVLIATGWIIIDNVWNIDLSAALTALGVTSIVISFALQDTLSGLASGLLLLSDQPFQTGDWIKVGDIEGQVVDVNWRTSRIKTRNGDMVIVPNSQLATSSLTNFSTPKHPHRVVVSLQVAYLNPPTLAKHMLLDAARGTPGVLLEPSPAAVVTTIDDPLMGYDVHMWIDDFAIEPRVKADFGALVWYQSNRHGVPLPSPAQDLYLYDGVKVGEDGQPSVVDIRGALQTSHLLGSVSDADLDRLARTSRPARFAVGEVMIDARDDSRDFMLVVEGRAELLLADTTRSDEDPELPSEMVITEVGAGEIIGILDALATGTGRPQCRAITDCEVVIIDADVAGEVGSRNAELADALNRLSDVRRRRAQRELDRLAAARDLDGGSA